jgi:hypothetical protein
MEKFAFSFTMLCGCGEFRFLSHFALPCLTAFHKLRASGNSFRAMLLVNRPIGHAL